MSQSKYPGTLSGRLRYAREQRGFGYNELGRLIGSKSGYVSKLEAGEIGSVGHEKLIALSKALTVSLDWLVRGVGDFEDMAA